MLRWVSDKSLSRYFKEIMRYRLLSREEEEGYARRARLGDVILQAGDATCNSARTLISAINHAGPGSNLTLTVKRGEETIKPELEIPILTPQSGKSFLLGMQVHKVSELETEQQKLLGLKKGLLVTEVDPDSPAANADLRDYHRESRDRLILHNLRWVVTIAKQYQNRGLPLAELINEGNLGLIQAVSKFDERRKTRLTTYSNWWIRYYIVSALASRHLIKLPIKMRNLAKKIRDSYGVLSQRFGRAPSIEELAVELGATPEEVSAAFDCGVAELSIDALPFEDSKVTFEEVLRDTSAPSPAELTAKGQIERDVRSSLDEALADRELYVVSRHFGVPLPVDRKFTVKKLSVIFGKTSDEIKGVICSATRKVISELRRTMGDGELKRYARLNSTDMSELPLMVRIHGEEADKCLARIMRKLVRNMSSMVSDHLVELDLTEHEYFTLYWQVSPSRQELNLRELGDLLGVSREAARQVKERAIKKLKKQLRPQAFDNFFREAV